MNVGLNVSVIRHPLRTRFFTCVDGQIGHVELEREQHFPLPLYNYFCQELSIGLGKEVGTGEFGADMKVELLNNGPVTICMDTKNKE